MERALDMNGDGARLLADVAAAPSDAEAYCHLGAFQFQRRNAAAAALALRRACIVSARAFDICVGRARAYAASGDRHVASLYAQAGAWIFETHKEDADTVLRRAGVLFDLSKLLEHDLIHEDQIAGLVASGVASASFLAKLGRAYWRKGDIASSDRFYTQAVIASANPQFAVELSEMRLESGYGREGITAYNLALKIAPMNPALCYGFSNALRRYNELSGWFDDALTKHGHGIADLLEHDLEVARSVVKYHGSADSSGRHLYYVSYTNKPEEETSRLQLNTSATMIGGASAVAAWDDAAFRATKFHARFESILSQPRGGGYWAWKPYIILLTLLYARDGDMVFYHDSGRSGYKYQIKQPLLPAFDWAQKNNNGALPGILINTMNMNWTKRDCFVLMGCDEENYWSRRQVQAGWSFWQKNQASISFVRKWAKYCTDPRIVTDFPNQCGEENFYNFIDHRHDQSILSLLCAREDVKAYGDPALPVWENSNDVNILLDVLRNAG